jgi:maltose/moltooligosaccharide transporter
VNGIIGGPVVKYFYGSQAIYALVIAGFLMLCAALTVLYVQDNRKIRMEG